MIKIEVKENNKRIREVSIKGHALYDDYGKDIVCAATSATVITTVNGILSIDKDYIKVTEGENLKIEILKHDKIVDSLINNMIKLLTELQNDYKENIDIRRC